MWRPELVRIVRRSAVRVLGFLNKSDAVVFAARTLPCRDTQSTCSDDPRQRKMTPVNAWRQRWLTQGEYTIQCMLMTPGNV